MSTQTVAPSMLPEPTPDVLAYLAERLEVRNVELRVSPAGELQLRDGDHRLNNADRAVVSHYSEPLADLLGRPQELDEMDTLKREPTHRASANSGRDR